MSQPMGRPLFHMFNTMAVTVGMALLLIGFLPFYLSYVSQSWPHTDGVILISRVDKGTELGWGLHGVSHADIRYYYQLGDHTFQGGRIEFGIGSRSFLLSAFVERLVARYPEGKGVLVYFNPLDPLDSVLERTPSIGSSMVWILFGFFCLAIGFRKRFVDHLP